MGSNVTLGIALIVFGLGLAGGGVVLLMQRTPKPVMPVGISRADAPYSPDLHQVETISTEQKGRQFEEWVVKRFNKGYFTLKEWRSDKYAEGIYPESSLHPDLEYEFRMREVREPFAVECKWRSRYDTGEKPYIVWAEDRQIENYRSFARERGIPVFVVIGIGGEPDDPAQVFVLNLDNLRFSKTTSEYLAKFSRQVKDSDFFFEYKTKVLR